MQTAGSSARQKGTASSRSTAPPPPAPLEASGIGHRARGRSHSEHHTVRGAPPQDQQQKCDSPSPSNHCRPSDASAPCFKFERPKQKGEGGDDAHRKGPHRKRGEGLRSKMVESNKCTPLRKQPKWPNIINLLPFKRGRHGRKKNTSTALQKRPKMAENNKSTALRG